MGASWQAFYAHLCAASIIRAMPETEIPPAMRGDLYYAKAVLYNHFFCGIYPFIMFHVKQCGIESLCY